jgi:hypothetical protein
MKTFYEGTQIESQKKTEYEAQRVCLGEILDQDASYRLGKPHANQKTTRETEDEKEE